MAWLQKTRSSQLGRARRPVRGVSGPPRGARGLVLRLGLEELDPQELGARVRVGAAQVEVEDEQVHVQEDAVLVRGGGERVEVVESWAEANPGRAFAREAVDGARGNESADATSRASGKDVGPCKFFINNGYCAKGDACKYAHDRAMQRNWIAERKANRRQLAVESGDPHGDSVASKHRRAGEVTSWLVDKCGVDVLNSGTGVLDVAGGRGDVSFELYTKMGIKSTLVEPRARKLNKHQHKWLKAEAKRLKTDALDTDSWLCEQIKTEFSSENWHLFKDCSIIVGMHPDQATEPIIDFAIQFKKPFAVVPCCVFPDLFKHRRDRQGKPVTQRASLVEYIADKTGGEVEYLDIEGANQVVFGTPKES